MPIRHEHLTQRYTAISFDPGANTDLQRSFAEILQRPVQVVEFPAEGASPEDSDTGTEPLSTFLDSVEPIRQQLAARRIRGDQLAPKEALVLHILNSLLEASFVPLAPEPADVRQALYEAHRLLKRYSHG